MLVLAILAIVPAVATPWFVTFWLGFDVWRRHQVATYATIFVFVTAVCVLSYRFRADLFAGAFPFPWWTDLLGWPIVAASFLLAMVADRQIGIRVRSFAPFFEDQGRIELVTTGAYGIVRHPIYAAGMWYQLGVFLLTGYPAILIALAILVAGAPWFTRQEERRLRTLLADPTAYDRYAERVPALVPGVRRRARRLTSAP
jgi:protein-S-isoprenylcysteine O-methyltransferase Ste14